MGTLSGNYQQYTELRQWILENGDIDLFDNMWSEFIAYRMQRDHGWCNIAQFTTEQDQYLWDNCPLEWLRIEINRSHVFDVEMYAANI